MTDPARPRLEPDHHVRVYRSPAPRPYQALLVSIGALAVIPGIVAAFMRLVPPADDASGMTASFIPYGMIADLIALVCFAIALVRGRQRVVLAIMTGLSALLLILQLVWIGPQFVANPRPVTTEPFTVISLNTELGSVDVPQLRKISEQADVVILVEVTPTAYRTIKDALQPRFPDVVPSTIEANNESMILSRYPLRDARKLESTNPQWSAEAMIPQLGQVNLIAAHPCNPLCGHGHWTSEHRALLHRAEQLDHRPEFLAGDFNATADHGPMRRLARHGFVSGTDITGAGWMPTYPANRRIVPPLIQIDHVLVNDRLTVTSIDRFKIAGTDHLGLIARLAGTG
ncbi:endonuclease/exonuclease/phosphatase family protein [Microlunatus elymi]|uniref:Endonuclease/exonuclease/phosphatase family protein n=1 Tax=Microlunatus elymi TaxID=2596828 RepID=A0A516PY56_9ACTN|nr:endonuclease/exonuclease/phosphatase family protein [Microlunatus elymi]QDP96115.1 endonuclease/exonuclease/phosphatase family protein [Microlunatus elymi]